MVNNQQLTFEGAMMIVQGDKWIQLKDIERLTEFIQEQQSTIEAKDKEIEESKITIQLYETDVSMRDNFLKSKGLYDEFLQCIWRANE